MGIPEYLTVLMRKPIHKIGINGLNGTWRKRMSPDWGRNAPPYLTNAYDEYQLKKSGRNMICILYSFYLICFIYSTLHNLIKGLCFTLNSEK